MLSSFSMNNLKSKIQKHRLESDAPGNKTAPLQQALAQIEAALSRKETQKVLEKAHNL
tara:strand:- start:484 stop:657 length:174 start_codon:yes stop_codon:yes gene_type:complete